METQTYNVKPGTKVRTAIEGAILMARTTGKTTIIKLNGAPFCVYPDTTFQKALDVYLEVKDKIFKTTQYLNQKEK